MEVLIIIIFFPGFKAPNYLNLFVKLNPEVQLDPKSNFILECFSEYHIRLLEQSIISFIKPNINDLNTACASDVILLLLLI